MFQLNSTMAHSRVQERNALAAWGKTPQHNVVQTCSISTSVPQKSFGCRNSTGLPWAPILGSPSPMTRAPSRLQPVAGRQDIIDLVADVMHAAIGVLFQKLRNGRILAQAVRSNSILVFGKFDENDRHAMVRQCLRLGHRGPKCVAVYRAGGLQIRRRLSRHD